MNGSRQRMWARKNYKQLVETRIKFYSNAKRGLELFNASIGYDLISPNGALTI